MTYKLLAVDVDGTLLRRDGKIRDDDRAAIERLRAAGVPVTIATGRLYSGSSGVARSIGLTGPIACVDGSHIVALEDDRALYYRSLVGKAAATLRAVIEREELASFVFAEDGIIHDEAGAPYAEYVSTWSTRIDKVEQVVAHPSWHSERGLMAVVSIGAEAGIKAAVEELAAKFGDEMFTVHFPLSRVKGRFALVARASGPTKGTAIRWLADHYGCKAEEVVVVGDWLNDIPMFEAAGRSFVMRKAPPVVRAAATDELAADTGMGGGVAEAIRRAFGV